MDKKQNYKINRIHLRKILKTFDSLMERLAVNYYDENRKGFLIASLNDEEFESLETIKAIMEGIVESLDGKSQFPPTKILEDIDKELRKK